VLERGIRIDERAEGAGLGFGHRPGCSQYSSLKATISALAAKQRTASVS